MYVSLSRHQAPASALPVRTIQASLPQRVACGSSGHTHADAITAERDPYPCAPISMMTAASHSDNSSEHVVPDRV